MIIIIAFVVVCLFCFDVFVFVQVVCLFVCVFLLLTYNWYMHKAHFYFVLLSCLMHLYFVQ